MKMDNISKYMLPLDEFDISLLSLNNDYLKTDTLRGKYDFEIKNNHSDESYVSDDNDSDTSYPDMEFETKICSICDIEVPEQYMNKHIYSDKHQMFLTITTIALERAKKQIKLNDFNTIKSSKSLYFCEICVTVVSVKDKQIHFSSEYHKNAVKKDNKMKDLINIYNNMDNYNEKVSKTDEILNETNGREITEVKIEDNTTAKELKNNKTIDRNIIIEINNCIMKIKIDHYNGIMNTAKHRYKCVFCNVTFKKKSKHINLKNHKAILKPIKDRNCIRKLKTAKSYCILCNKLIDSDDTHVNKDEHKNRLRNAIISDFNAVEDQKTVEEFKSKDKFNVEVDDFDRDEFEAEVEFRAEDEFEAELYFKSEEYEVEDISGAENVFGAGDVSEAEDIVEEETYEYKVDDKFLAKLDAFMAQDEFKADGEKDNEAYSTSDIIDVNSNCICYICNVKVPKKFMKNHLNSSKHKNYLKIANTAFRRINKMMNQSVFVSKSGSSLYFCDICVIAIKNKAKHILSDSHKIAVKKDKIFNSLVDLYIDDDLNLDDCDTLETNNKRNYKKTIDNGEVTSSPPEDEGSDDELDDTNSFIKDKDILTIKEQEITENQLRILNSNINGHTLKSLDRNNYIIETDGIQIKVNRHNYHGFKKIGKRKYLCQLCSSFCQRKGVHMLSEKHLKKVSSPIKDNHCIREVDSSITHCILCNELIESYLLHTMCNEKHLDLLKKSIIHTEDDLINDKVAKSVDDNKLASQSKATDNIELNKHDNTLDVGSPKLPLTNESNDKLPSIQDSVAPIKQENTTNVLNKNELKEQNNIIPTNVIQNESNEVIVWKASSNKHPDLYMIKTTSQGKSCYFCDVKIPNTTHNITEHLNGSKHRQTVTELLTSNGLKNKNGQIHCDYCHIYIKKESQYYHMELESHKALVNGTETTSDLVKIDSDSIDKEKIDELKALVNQLAEVISVQEIDNQQTNVETDEIEFNPFIMEKTQRGNEILCKICNVIVPLTKCNIQEHIIAKKHKTNEKELLEKNQIINKDSRIYCDICVNYIIDPFVHIPTYFHTKRMEIYQYQNKKNNEVTDVTDGYLKRIKTIFTYVLSIQENGNLWCKICNASIPNKESNITEHVDGRKHKFNEIETFRRNKMIIKDINSHCEACSLYIMNGMEHVHMETTFHKENIKNNSIKADKVNENRMKPIEFPSNEFYGLVRSKLHVVRCTICDVDVPDSVATLKMHVGGALHKNKLNKIFPNL